MMLQDFPLEVQQELFSHIGTVWLSFVMWEQSAVCKQPMAFSFHCSSCVAQCAPALIVVPCCMKSASNTPLWSHSVVVCHFISRHHNLELFQLLEPRMFPLHACKFCHHGMVMNPCVISSDSALEKFLAANGILLQE